MRNVGRTWLGSSGTTARIRVPMPGSESMVRWPPSTSTRSARFIRPAPALHPAGIEPDAGVVDRERDLVRLADEADPDGGRGAAVLDGVLEGLQAAEVDGSLELRLVAAEPDGFDRDLARRVVRDGPERLDDAVAEEQLRAAVAGDVADLARARRPAPADPLDRLAILGRRGGLGEQPQVDPRC